MESEQAVVGRDVEARAQARLGLVYEFERREHVHHFAADHIIVVEALVTRTHYDLIARAAEMCAHYGELVDKHALDLGILLAIHLGRGSSIRVPLETQNKHVMVYLEKAERLA